MRQTIEQDQEMSILNLLNFFKQRAAEGKYQTEINRVLRAHVGAELRGKSKAAANRTVRANKKRG